MGKIDLNRKVKDVEIELLDSPAPEEELESNVLTALYYIGRNSSNADGFWIMAHQVVAWMEGNGMEVPGKTTEEMSSKVGRVLKAFGFRTSKRFAAGVYRWVNREKLMTLIEKFNDGETDKKPAENFVHNIKRLVFRAYLDEVDIQEIEELKGVDMTIIQSVSKEMMELGEAGVKKWLEDNE